MLEMATMLMGPWRRQAALHPGTTFCIFADERTAATTTKGELQSIESEWDVLESVTAMRTNTSKTQFFTILPDQCDDHHLRQKSMKCLSLDFSMQRTTKTDREQGKLVEACARMRRIA